MRAVMSSSSRLLLNAALYGLGAFAIGFTFGVLRELVFIPRFGERTGHLLEFPLVTGCIVVFGWWLARLKGSRPSAALLFGVGGVGVLLAIESAFALGFLGMSLEDYLATFNLAQGALFPYALALMAIAPFLSAWSARR
mgnify:CR=1 FL=1